MRFLKPIELQTSPTVLRHILALALHKSPPLLSVRHFFVSKPSGVALRVSMFLLQFYGHHTVYPFQNQNFTRQNPREKKGPKVPQLLNKLELKLLFVTEETQFCVNGELHTEINQCNRGSYANPLYVVQEGPDIMRLKPTMSGPSHTPI